MYTRFDKKNKGKKKWLLGPSSVHVREHFQNLWVVHG